MSGTKRASISRRELGDGGGNMLATKLRLKLSLALVVVTSTTVAMSTNLLPDNASMEQRGDAKSNSVFFDDFSGKTLDRSKWNVRITGPTYNNEQQAYVDSTDTIYIVHGEEAAGAANGALVIQPRFRPGFITPEGKKFDFISGRIDTHGKMEFANGTASARMKLPDGAGLWPAFW